MLGELHKPKGLARETAQAVLEVEEPYAVNVALGCSNDCDYCYGPKAMRCSRETWRKMRFPKRSPIDLVRKQVDKGLNLEGVFLSFLTDPFLAPNWENTEDLIKFLVNTFENIIVATSSKKGITSLGYGYVRSGFTIVSLDSEFWKEWEPRTRIPMERVRVLEARSEELGYTWVSMEPYPPSDIWKQNITNVLEAIKFVNLIVFGKWNYDKRATTEKARSEYADNIHVSRDFCKSNGIRLHVKSDMLKFAFPEVQP